MLVKLELLEFLRNMARSVWIKGLVICGHQIEIEQSAERTTCKPIWLARSENNSLTRINDLSV